MLTNKKMIIKLNEDKTKTQVLKNISIAMKKLGFIDDEKTLYESFKAREKEFSTGIGSGVAIPHAEVENLKEPKIFIARVNDINWESLDGKPVKVAVAIMVPKGGRGEHLTILAELSKKMANEEFLEILKKGTKTEVEELINSVKIEEKEEVKPNNKGTKFIVGITACPTGIAHTYLAQQKIIDACEKEGYSYKIETQGSEGIRDKLTVEEISKADAIIISTGKELEFMERFNGFEGKIYNSELQNTIKNNGKVVADALKHGASFQPTLGTTSDGESSTTFTSKRKSKFEIGMGHMMSGISAFIPLIITAGLLMAIGNIGALYWVMTDTAHTSISSTDWINGTLDSNLWIHLMWWVQQIGSITMKFMFPFFTMYLAMSIGGRVVMIPAFIGGVMAAGLETSFFTGDFFTGSGLISWAYPNGFISSSFFGAIIIGFFVGTFGKFLNNKIQVTPNFMTFKTLLAIPLILMLSTFLLMGFVINPIFGMVNWGISEAFSAAGDSGRYIYNWTIAAGMASDLGGPVNKAALSVAYGFMDSTNADVLPWLQSHLDQVGTDEWNGYITQLKTFNVTGKNIGQVIPPIGLGFAALFGNKITGRHLFDNEDVQLGGQSAFLGTIGISEGAIPFLLKYPAYVIIADIIGAIVGVTIAMLFGTIQLLAIPAIWGWFLAGSTTIGIPGVSGYGVQVVGYFAGVIVGAMTTAAIIITLLFVHDIKQDKGNKVYNKNQRDLLSGDELQTVQETTDNSLKNIKSYFVEQLETLGDVNIGEIFETSQSAIDSIDLSFSKEKVKLAAESNKLSKLNFAIQRDKTKQRQLNSQINELTLDRDYKINSAGENKEKINSINTKIDSKISKLKESIDKLNSSINENEKLLQDEKNKVATYIQQKLEIIERI